jgi:YVTN family beta-propeller protein
MASPRWSFTRTLAAASCTAVFVLAACSEDQSPTAPSLPVSAPGAPAPSYLISDGAHSGGVIGFYWFLPQPWPDIRPDTSDSDILGLDPVVTIRACSDDNCSSVGAVVNQFTRTSKPALTYNKGGMQYQVSWDTKPRALGTYRMDVVAGAAGFRRTLGVADVKLFAKNPSSTAQRIGWKQGSAFAIIFRLRTRIAGAVTIAPPSATIPTGGSQQFTATLRDLHGSLLRGANVSWQWTSSPATGVIASLTPATGPTNSSGQAVVTVTAGSTPGSATVSALSDTNTESLNNRLVATATLTVSNPSPVIASIPVAGCPQGITVDATRARTYVASFDAGTVSVIDAGSNTVLTSVGVGSGPTHLAANAATNRIFVPNISSNDVSVIDGSNNTVVETVPGFNTPTFAAVNATTDRVYVTNQANSHIVSVLDGGSDAVVASIILGAPPVGIAVNPMTNMVYASMPDGDAVAVIDGATNEVVSTLGVGDYPISVAVDTITNRVYVGLYFDESIAVIDGATNSVSTTIPLGFQPGPIAVNPGDNLIYTARDGSSAPLVTIDGETNAVTASGPIFTSIRDMAWNSSLGRLYAADCGDNTVKVIQ